SLALNVFPKVLRDSESSTRSVDLLIPVEASHPLVIMTDNSSQYYIIYIPALLPDSHICFQIKRAVARLSGCLSHLEKILLFLIFYMASGIHAGLLIECGEVVQDFLRNFGGRRSPMAWTLLLVAGFFEIVWATALKYTDGFTRLWPSIATVLAMAISMVC